MAEYTGKNLYVIFGTTVLDGGSRVFDPTEEIGLVDASAGSAGSRTYITTLEDGRASMELVDQTGDTAIWGAVDLGVEATLEWAPEGTASGKPKHSCNAIVMSRNKRMPYDEVVTITVEFQFSGVVTDTVY
jgi:hypothetical protein